jgi:hypothetical protein
MCLWHIMFLSSLHGKIKIARKTDTVAEVVATGIALELRIVPAAKAPAMDKTSKRLWVTPDLRGPTKIIVGQVVLISDLHDQCP